MKITMYELLGMIKDGKAPKRIIYGEYVYELNEGIENYESEINPLITIDWDYVVMNSLNDEVEILEEEKKIPEKLGKIEDNDGYIDQYDVIKIGRKVDEIIDYLESKEKGE